MTPLTPSRVPLLLETTKVTKPACSAVKIRGRTAFLSWRSSWLGVLARFCKSKFWEISIDRLIFDRSTSGKIRLIEFKFDRSSSSELRIFQVIPHEFCHSSLIDLQNIKTQKLTKASENNKAKGLNNVNQGVQIYNIWHSSNTPKVENKIKAWNISLLSWEKRLHLAYATSLLNP